MFESIVRPYKYIQQNPAAVSRVPISEPSALYLVNPPSIHSSESEWRRLTDGTSGRSVKVLGDQAWVGSRSQLWLGRCRTSNLLSLTFFCVFGVGLCGELLYSFFLLYFVLASSRDKFSYSTLTCIKVISVLLISTSRTAVELAQWIFKQRIPTARWPESVCSVKVVGFFLNSFFNLIEHDFMYKSQTRGRRGWIIQYVL